MSLCIRHLPEKEVALHRTKWAAIHHTEHGQTEELVTEMHRHGALQIGFSTQKGIEPNVLSIIMNQRVHSVVRFESFFAHTDGDVRCTVYFQQCLACPRAHRFWGATVVTQGSHRGVS